MNWQRIFHEKRRYLVPLAAIAAINVAVFALVVYPLSARTGAAERRAATAAANHAKAAAEFRAAEATKVGRERADQQLERFYQEVLPRDQAGARRITYLRLAKLADEAGLDSERRAFTPNEEKGEALNTLNITLALRGEYADIRRFIHRLETSPEFVVIREVSLAQRDQDEPLTLTLQLATFYKAAS